MGSPRWAVCAARLPSFRNFFTLMRLTHAACACPRPPPSRPAMWASRCGRRPLGRVHSVVRCRASRRLPQVLIYLFCLCDHLTEYFTNLMILLYNEYYFCSCGALALVAAAAAATAANATDGEVPAVPNHKDGDKQVHRSSPAHRCRGRGV